MPKKRRRGRPRTGHDPVVPARLPRQMLQKVNRIAELLSLERSAVVRWLIKQGLDSGGASLLLRSGRGKGVTGQYLRLVRAEVVAAGAASAAMRASPKKRPAAEIKAQHALEHAAEVVAEVRSWERERLYDRRASRAKDVTPAAEPRRSPQRLSRLKAIADRREPDE
jgi:hypothetical protein